MSWSTSSAFRKLGHNEQDTPGANPTVMYKGGGGGRSRSHPGNAQSCTAKKCLRARPAAGGGPDDMSRPRGAAMDAPQKRTRMTRTDEHKSKYAVEWAPFLGNKKKK